MTTDRTTKALLLAIAIGLWTRIAGAWLSPTPAHAQGTFKLNGDPQLTMITTILEGISHDTTSMSSSLRALQIANLTKK